MTKKMMEKMTGNPKSSNKKKFDQELIVVARPITEVLTGDINDKREIEFGKSPSDKNKLNNQEKTCRHFSRYKCVNRDVFKAFYEDYTEYKNYISDILNNRFQPDKLDTFEKTTESNKALHKQQEKESGKRN